MVWLQLAKMEANNLQPKQSGRFGQRLDFGGGSSGGGSRKRRRGSGGSSGGGLDDYDAEGWAAGTCAFLNILASPRNQLQACRCEQTNSCVVCKGTLQQY